MYSLAIIVDNQNHKFLSNFLTQECKKILITEVALASIVGHPANYNFLTRLRIARVIKRWIKANDKKFDGILIFSDYYFGYRTLVHFCRSYKKPIFIYQDGFIIFEPWPKNISGLFKRAVHLGFKVFGHSHLMSYLSFHSNPNLVFSWGNRFTRTFRNTTSSEVVTIGSTMYAKSFNARPDEIRVENKILYYGTYYRDPEKNIIVKARAIKNLREILKMENGMTCDIKLHPLEKDTVYMDGLLTEHSLNSTVNFLTNDFLLHENIGKYRFIVSEFSTETIFASLFNSNIYFIKNGLNEKHFRSIEDFLITHEIAGQEYYTVDRTQIDKFKSEYFQEFNVERFEQAIQEHN